MPDTTALFIHGFLVLVLVLIILIFRSKQPQTNPLAKYFRAEPSLALTSHLFVLVICVKAFAQLALRLGFLGAQSAERVESWTDVPFFILLAAVLILWVRAILKVRRSNRAA